MPLHFIEDYMESVGGSEGKCGRKWTLPISGKYQYELVSNGRAVMGNCSTTVVVGRSSRCEKKICVRVEEWALDSDVMNVTFKGQKDGDMVSERGGYTKTVRRHKSTDGMGIKETVSRHRSTDRMGI